MNEQEIQTETDDTAGNAVGSKHIETDTAETDDTAGNVVGSRHIETEGNAISPRRAFPNTTKPGRSLGTRH
jgi:hypothetical protein